MRRSFLFTLQPNCSSSCSAISTTSTRRFFSHVRFSSSLRIGNARTSTMATRTTCTPATPLLLFQRRVQSSSGGSDDYYSLLGVSPSATTAEIKAAYKKQALKYHPDRNKESGAEDKFKRVSEAYSVLSNDEKKRQYDTMRQYGGGGGGGGRTYPGGGGFGGNPFSHHHQGPHASYGSYGSNGGGPPRGGANQQQQQQQHQGNNPFFVHNMSKEEADRIFQSIFGGGFGGGAGGGGRSGNPMDDIFGRPGTHPSQTGYSFPGSGGPQVPPGATLQSKTTSRNADGTFQRDEIYKLPDGRTIKISHVYEKSGSPPDEGSPQSFQQRSGGFRNFSEQVAGQYYQQQQQQQRSTGEASPGAATGDSNQKVNFPHNPFSSGGGFSSQSRASPFGGGFGGMPGSGFGSSSSSSSWSASSNPFSSFSSAFSNGGPRPGTGGAFAGGSSTTTNGGGFNNPWASMFGRQRQNPMGGFFFYSPGLRLLAVSLLIGFVLASLFSFTIHHPMFFLFLVTLFWLSRGRRFF